MERSVTVKAPCKLNIHLEVEKPRSDGFHNLKSIFQLVSLCDTIKAAKIEESACRVHCREMDLPVENTITRAFDAFRQATGIKGGAAFKLTKRVPSGAGLGGGSSDGAAALRALNLLYGTRLSIEEMEALALKVGSDCPFFIRGGAALVGGRGDELFWLGETPKLHCVIVWPGVSSSTKEAYALLDAAREGAASGAGNGAGGGASLSWDELRAEYLKPPSEWRFFNSFAPILRAKEPLVGKALAGMREEGAAFCNMTGSGAAIFGVFNDEQAARNAFCRLSCLWTSCFLVFSLDFSLNL